jgi:glucose-6-phosphate 1-dehydrogenase
MAQSSAAGVNSDTLVLYGPTGDLATKMIFPALARLRQRGVRLRIIGVTHAQVEPATLLAPVRARLMEETPELATAFDEVASHFETVSGDLRDRALYEQLSASLAGTRNALHYLAVPPHLFASVVEHLARARLAAGARVAIEKPFGHDRESARTLEATVAQAFPDPASVFRIDHFLGKNAIRNLSFMRARSPWLDRLWTRASVSCVQVTMAESFGIAQRGAFYESVGALRDVFQNHLLELVAVLAMEPVAMTDQRGFIESRIAAMRSIRPLTPDDVVRGQYEGYRAEPHVARDSRVETYLAARVHVDNDRFAGVPFLVRAGKRTAVTDTSVSLTLPIAASAESGPPESDHLRLHLGPGSVTMSLDTRALVSGTTSESTPLSLAAALPPDRDDEAYMNVLAAALSGDHSVSEQAAGVDAAWRVVADVLDSGEEPHAYAQGSWGPPQADRLLPEHESWYDPVRR